MYLTLGDNDGIAKELLSLSNKFSGTFFQSQSIRLV